MIILLSNGIGYASAEKAAFDAALAMAGVEHYNHVLLSSVVPFNSTIIEGVSPNDIYRERERLAPSMVDELLEEHGKIVYSVMAHRTSLSMASVAGILVSPNPYAPFIVEASSTRENDVQEALISSAKTMLRNRMQDYCPEKANTLVVDKELREHYNEFIIRIARAEKKQGMYSSAVSIALFIKENTTIAKVVMQDKRTRVIART
ncbi:MAG: hypothetical protein D6769_01055 [Methanobacteriota archaeon]|nr:MAG: hypothetical protein D6769_01055 [Euryarchaeota archaeon]